VKPRRSQKTAVISRRLLSRSRSLSFDTTSASCGERKRRSRSSRVRSSYCAVTRATRVRVQSARRIAAPAPRRDGDTCRAARATGDASSSTQSNVFAMKSSALAVILRPEDQIERALVDREEQSSWRNAAAIPPEARGNGTNCVWRMSRHVTLA